MHDVGLLGVEKSTTAASAGQDQDPQQTCSGQQGVDLLVLQAGVRPATAGRPDGGESKEAGSIAQAGVERVAGRGVRIAV